MARHDLHVAAAHRRCESRACSTARRQNTAKVVTTGMQADRGKAAGRRHHVLFGDAELQEALGMALAEMMHAGAAGDVGVEHDDVAGIRRRDPTSALPNASRSESPLDPIRAGASAAIDIETAP